MNVIQELPMATTSCVKSDIKSEPKSDKLQIPSIVDSISQQQIDDFQPFHKRYFEERYCTNFTTEEINLDTCIRVHSNKISVIFLSQKHSIFERRQRIKRLNFQVGSKLNRLQNTMSGKGKRGAQLLTPQSILCYMETQDNTQYPIYSGIYGKLLEINDRILENPNLILDDLNEGFLAIILPDMRKHEENMQSLTPAAEYN